MADYAFFIMGAIALVAAAAVGAACILLTMACIVTARRAKKAASGLVGLILALGSVLTCGVTALPGFIFAVVGIRQKAYPKASWTAAVLAAGVMLLCAIGVVRFFSRPPGRGEEVVQVSGAALDPYRVALGAVDRRAMGFPPLPTNGTAKIETVDRANWGYEYPPPAYDAALHFYEITDRGFYPYAYRTVMLKKAAGGFTWISEQMVFSGPGRFTTEDGESNEQITITCEKEPVAFIGTNLTGTAVSYMGNDKRLAAATPYAENLTIAQVAPILREWGYDYDADSAGKGTRPTSEEAVTARASGVRVSFLDEEWPLQDTLSRLLRHGCPSGSMSAFEKAVRQYYGTPFRIDRARFPAPAYGFYAFKSAADFATVLPYRLCDIDHPYGVNCFVPVLGLSGLSTALKPDDLLGPMLAVVNRGGQAWDTRTVATPRDVFLESYGPDYAKQVESITGSPWTDQQICLMASLHACHMLPRSTTAVTLRRDLLGVLQSRWRTGGIRFPTNALVTMLHAADLAKRFRVLTDHAGFMVPTEGGYMYVEKAGGQGPFLRIDLAAPEDLVPYYRSFVTAGSRGDMTHWLMTVNDQEIYWVDRGQAAAD